MFALMILAMGVNAASQSMSSDNVVRCARENITGSLARTRRVCHTVGEWRRIQKAAQVEVDRVIEDGVIRPVNR